MTRLARVAALALALGAASAEAQSGGAPLAEAERAEREGRLLDADRAYQRVLEGGGLTPPDVARAHLRLGVLARALGADPSAAEDHFAIGLAIDPALAAPDELPPPERARFEAMRGAGYTITGRLDGRALRVEVAGAPPIARSLRVEGSAAEVRLVDGAATITPPADARAVEITALDAHGNAIRTAPIEIARPALAVIDPPRAEPRSPDLRLECPREGDPCGWPAHCRSAPRACEAAGEDLGPIVGGVVGAILGVAAVIAIAVSVDAYQSSLWRVDQVGLR